MLRKYLVAMMAVFGFAVLPACEALDQDVSADDEMAVDEAELALSAQLLWKGNIAYGTIKSGTLTNTSVYENVNQWRFMPTAGQTVTFGLDIPTSAGGAWLCMSTSLNLPTSCSALPNKEAKSTTATHVQVTHTFANTTGVYLYVRQVTPAVGSFAYKLSTQPEKCATMSGSIYDNFNTPSSGWWTLFSAKHFLAGSTENPSTWTPSVSGGTFSTNTRSVKPGSCTSNQATNCGTANPALTCEGDFMGYGPTDNTCTAKNLMLVRADNNVSWVGWYQAITPTSLCYEM